MSPGLEPSSEPLLKPVDAWWTVIVIDPIAVRMVALVRERVAVTPTRLTAAAHLLGLVSAVAFARGHLVVAALLFEIRFVLDCADGKLARVRGSSSAAGAFFDYVGDYIVVGANVVGVALYLVWAGEVSVGLAVGLPAAYLAHVAAGQAREKEWLALGRRPGLPGRGPAAGGYRHWMQERRLRAMPSRPDAEHVLLFVAPVAAVLMDEPRVLVWVAWLATTYFMLEVAHLTARGYQLAAERDGSPAGPASGDPRTGSSRRVPEAG